MKRFFAQSPKWVTLADASCFKRLHQALTSKKAAAGLPTVGFRRDFFSRGTHVDHHWHKR
jgi:hypothetical protein